MSNSRRRKHINKIRRRMKKLERAKAELCLLALEGPDRTPRPVQQWGWYSYKATSEMEHQEKMKKLQNIIHFGEAFLGNHKKQVQRIINREGLRF